MALVLVLIGGTPVSVDFLSGLSAIPAVSSLCPPVMVIAVQTSTLWVLALWSTVAIHGVPHIARRHAAVPRALQLRVALDDWDRNDVHL